jgi:hypothetical protein
MPRGGVDALKFTKLVRGCYGKSELRPVRPAGQWGILRGVVLVVGAAVNGDEKIYPSRAIGGISACSITPLS